MAINQPNLKLTGILFKHLYNINVHIHLYIVLKAEGLVKRSFFCKNYNYLIFI